MQSTGTIVPAAIETLASKFTINPSTTLIVNKQRLLFRLEDSIHDFDQAIELDSTNPIIYSNRGLVNRKMERF